MLFGLALALFLAVPSFGDADRLQKLGSIILIGGMLHWPELEARGVRRVRALLGGAPLAEDDPAAAEIERYGLGAAFTLAQWLEYSGFDYAAGTMRTPWP